MNKVIRIFKGDEYRPKIEKEFREDDFFSEVYNRAYSILKEIQEEMGARRLENREERHFALDEGSVGNNIIAFCGRRGQGKSSAMQSFAVTLDNVSQWKTFGNEVDCSKYLVLKRIDPSSLENGESIIRVLLSKMFYGFQEWEDERQRTSRQMTEFRKESHEILELFQQCYDDIDYIKEGQSRERRNDLEALARQGNSAQLRRNLTKLIDKYLRWVAPEKESGAECLVIQIDDADLATRKIFEICEDIRNYLALPNVVILMGMDFVQFSYAIYQRYLHNYKELHDLQRGISVEEKCYDMAARYLEKTLPGGHRVMLPDIDTAISEHTECLKFEYLEAAEPKDGAAKARDLLPEEIGSCSDMQEQLLKLIYLRTGIVLVPREGQVHPFLPHTLRELTHMLKMLGGMYEVDCDRVYGAQEKIGRLKSNLVKLKQYFMDDWCSQNLKLEQKELLEDIDRANQNRNNQEVYRYVRQYLKSIGRTLSLKSVGYRDILHTLVGEELSDEIGIQSAIEIYYTIFLNEWFAAALEDSGEYGKIVEFLQTPICLSPAVRRLKPKTGYFLTDFRIETEELKKLLPGSDSIENSMATVLDAFCFAEESEEDSEEEAFGQPIFIEDKEKNTITWNPEAGEIYFNVLNLLFKVLLSQSRFLSGQREASVPQDSLGDSSVEDIKGANTVRSAGSDRRYLSQIRNILSNVDVQLLLQNRLDKEYKGIYRKRGREAWLPSLNRIYSRLDSWVERVAYLGIESSVRDVFAGCVETVASMYSIFLSCASNRKRYWEEYRGCFLNFIRSVQEFLGSERELVKKLPEDGENVLNRIIEMMSTGLTLKDPAIAISFDGMRLPPVWQQVSEKSQEVTKKYYATLSAFLSLQTSTDESGKDIGQKLVINQNVSAIEQAIEECAKACQEANEILNTGWQGES